jgi:hypothetical protein
VFFVRLFEGSVALTFAGPLLAIPVATVSKSDQDRRTAAVITGALSIAVMPQMLGRTEIVHSLYTVAPALTSAAALISASTRKAWLVPIALGATFVQQSTSPGEAIFVGATQHQQVHANEMDLYFLADRPGARRYMQFDPNVINREDVQKEMIAQLETKQVRLVILSRRYMSNNENNESQKRGSDLLDR